MSCRSLRKKAAARSRVHFKVRPSRVFGPSVRGCKEGPPLCAVLDRILLKGMVASLPTFPSVHHAASMQRHLDSLC